MSFINMLSWWQWAVLGAVPPAIVLLYFLKLKRLPLEVPSTFLWHKSIEDLRVNSIWQRLRKNLLLVLQLLLIALAMAALARPGWQGTNLLNNRFIFLVDNSASMKATDVEPARLAEAKRRVAELIDQMRSGDVAMIVSFADTANVEQPFTANRRELRRRLDAIAPTNRSTRLGEALRVAAGLANPGRSSFEVSDTRVAESQPATLYILSDGRFPDVQGFALGNLTPQYFPIGEKSARNVAITAFSTRRPEGRLNQLQAFGRIENFTPEELAVQVELYLDAELVDAQKVQLKPRGAGGVVFELGEVEEGTLRLSVGEGGDLAVDDQAWAAVNRPRTSRVLLATPGNEALELALETDQARELAAITKVAPAELTDPKLVRQMEAGAYDLVIFDQCRPREMPRANTLFIGRVPSSPGWSGGEARAAPQVIDVEASHPLMQLVELGNVQFIEGTPLKTPAGGTVLIDSDRGPLFAIASREGFEDAVLGVEIMSVDEKGQMRANTDWPLRLSFPVFVLNSLEYLGGNRQAAASGTVLPGSAVALRATGSAERITVRKPSGKTSELSRGRLNTFSFNDTDELGVYTALEGGKPVERFAVNLFDSAESDIRPRPDNTVKIGNVDVRGRSVWAGARREVWRPLVVVALAVLLLEWYIYNRRVFI